MAPVDEKVLSKIKKCLALTSSSAPAEAATALAMAQALMAKHGVSASELETTPTEEVVEEAVRSIATAARCKAWELRLFRAIAKIFGCELLFQRGVKYTSGKDAYAHYLLIGLATEAAAARYAAEVLLRQLSRGRAKFTESLRESWMDRQAKTREVDAYCDGWVLGASEKAQALTQARVEAAQEADRVAGTSTALVVVSREAKRDALVKAAKEAKAGGRVGLNMRGLGSQQARAEGYATLHRGLGVSTAAGHLRGGK
jgi:hypothetical protein